MALREDLYSKIVNDFVSTNLCSYQISKKYGVDQRTVKSIIKGALGLEFFNNKDAIALNNLEQEVKNLLDKGYTSYDLIAKRLGVSRGSMYRFINDRCISTAKAHFNGSTDIKHDIIEITPSKSPDTQLTTSVDPTAAVQANNVTVSVTNPTPVPEVKHDLQVQCPSNLNTVNIAFNGNNISYQTALPIEESVAKVLKSLAV